MMMLFPKSILSLSGSVDVVAIDRSPAPKNWMTMPKNAARALADRGHSVTVHGRNAQRATDAANACPGAAGSYAADLSSVEATKFLAATLNAAGPWDCVIHNAGVMRIPSGSKGPEGIPTLFATNTLAPYILTSLLNPPPERIVFLSSELHLGGDPSLRNLQASGYNDSKLHNTMMAKYFAKRFPTSEVSSLDPGWVPTKMGGPSTTDTLEDAVQSYVMLVEGTGQSGEHWFHDGKKKFMEQAADEKRQEALIEQLEAISGVKRPGNRQPNM